MAKGSDCTPEGIPVSVPDPMDAAVIDSLLAAAIAAMFEATGSVVLPADAKGVLVLIDEPGVVFTSCPAEVGNTADVPAGAEVVGAEEPEAGAVAEAVAVEPSSGTDAAAPVEPVLM